MNKVEICEKFRSKAAKIGIVGLGYVGLPLAVAFAEAGFATVGFDIDDEKIESINKGRSYIKHISPQKVCAARDDGLAATSDFSEASSVDAIILCVPTPLNAYREPDLSYVVGTLESLLPYLKQNQILVLESTTYPGTTDEQIVPRIEREGFSVGEDFFVAYSPEREDPGNPDFTTRSIPKVVGGATTQCLNIAKALYEEVVDELVLVSSCKTAEMTKLLENIHRAVNIGLVNEMKIIADQMGIDIYEVITAAASKPFGFVPYYPGPGLGGHCIPIDPFYLTWKARQYGLHTRFIELAGEVNSDMPKFVVAKVSDALNYEKKAVNGSRILMLGVAYKKNVDDMRESPAVKLMQILTQMGAQVDYSDPLIPVFPSIRAGQFNLESVLLSPSNLASYDLVLLTTDHDDFDYEMIGRCAQLIVDTRGRFRGSVNARVICA